MPILAVTRFWKEHLCGSPNALIIPTCFYGNPLPPVIPTRYRMGDMVLSMFSMFAQFGTAEDIALADLKIELMFPADLQTRDVLEQLGASMPTNLTP